MKKLLVDRIPFAKLLTVLAVTILVGLGLCGVGFAGESGSTGHSALQVAAGVALVIGAAGFWLSLLGIVVTFVVWIVAAIIDSFSRE